MSKLLIIFGFSAIDLGRDAVDHLQAYEYGLLLTDTKMVRITAVQLIEGMRLGLLLSPPDYSHFKPAWLVLRMTGKTRLPGVSASS